MVNMQMRDDCTFFEAILQTKVVFPFVQHVVESSRRFKDDVYENICDKIKTQIGIIFVRVTITLLYVLPR
jgi:hypothetical protein